MKSKTAIPIYEICLHYQVERSFLVSLNEIGLIELWTENDEVLIDADQIPHLEKIIRFYEMDINLEGIETITYLLDHLNLLHQKTIDLTNRLRMYEDK